GDGLVDATGALVGEGEPMLRFRFVGVRDVGGEPSGRAEQQRKEESDDAFHAFVGITAVGALAPVLGHPVCAKTRAGLNLGAGAPRSPALMARREQAVI